MIKTADYLNGSGLSITIPRMEKQALSAMVDAAARAMKNKLHQKRDNGAYSGWDDEELLPDLKQSLIKHIEKGFSEENMIDVMNLAAMIWNQLQE